MKSTMTTAVLVGIKSMVTKTETIPKPKADEVLVKIDAMGICGSDLHFFAEGRIGAAQIVGERVLGHEVCGTIAECGVDVIGLQAGDRVALNPTRACGNCSYCRSGRENLCTVGTPRFLGNAFTDGAAREFFVSPQSRVYKLPVTCPVERAVLLEPFSVALHAVCGIKPELGSTAIVIGAGCIGLMTLLALRCKGISNIVVIDLVKSRLDKAFELGASHVINATSCDAVAAIKEYTQGQGAEIVIETVGSDITQAQTVHFLKKGGSISIVGMSSSTGVKIDMNTLLRKEGTIHTVFRFSNEFETAAKIVSEQEIPLEKIITHRYKLNEMQKAFEESLELKDTVIKAIINI